MVCNGQVVVGMITGQSIYFTFVAGFAGAYYGIVFKSFPSGILITVLLICIYELLGVVRP